jgi:hypothetical protein
MKKKQSNRLIIIYFLLVLGFLLSLIGCNSTAKPETTGAAPNEKSNSTTTTGIKATTTNTQNPSNTTLAPQTTSISSNLKSNISLDIELPAFLETLETLIFNVKPAITSGQIAPNALWQWEFGDGTPSETKLASYLTVGHRYNKVGAYKIKVSLIDQATKQALATATKSFIISDIDSIKKSNHLRVMVTLSGQTEYRQGAYPPEYNLKTFDSELYRKDPFTFEWYEEWRNGDAERWGGDEIKFKGDWGSVNEVESGTQTTEYWMSGKIVVTTEGMKLVDYYYYKKFDNPAYKGTDKEWMYDYQLNLNPIPLTKVTGGESPKYQFRLQGYKNIYPYIEYAGYTDNFYNSKAEIQWLPMEVPSLTGSDLQIAIDTYKLTN